MPVAILIPALWTDRSQTISNQQDSIWDITLNGTCLHYYESLLGADRAPRILGLSAGVQNGKQWETTRSHFDPFFSHGAAMNFRSFFSEEIRKWLKELRTSHNVSPGDTDHFDADALDACRILPFKLIAYSCYGRELVTEEVCLDNPKGL